MSGLSLDPSNPPGSLREVLIAAGYTEPAVAQHLGTVEVPPLLQRVQALPQYLWRTRHGTPLDVLIRLFLLRQSVASEAAAAALAPVPLDAWGDAGLLSPGSAEAKAAVELTPFQALLLVADWPDADAEPVMSVASTSRALAQLMIRRPIELALDLGTGCGVLALLLAAHSQRVWAVDLNPRASPVTRFNAALNGRANIEARTGDLFEPVRGQLFDQIVCNPPFVIGPGRGLLHTQVGRPLDQLARDIVREAAGFLREGGYCQMVCNWAHLSGQDEAQRLAGWFADTGCDAWVLRSHTEDAASYALKRVGERTDAPEPAARMFEEWMAYFEREQVEAISYGVLTMRRSAARPNWFRCEALPPRSGPYGAAIEQRFRLSDFLRAHSDDPQLLACRFRAADNLRWDVEQKLAAGTWTTTASQMWSADGLSFRGNADREVVEFLASCKGDRPLSDQLRKIAAQAKQDVNRLAPGFLKVVRRFIELGWLLPVEEKERKLS